MKFAVVGIGLLHITPVSAVGRGLHLRDEYYADNNFDPEFNSKHDAWDAIKECVQYAEVAPVAQWIAAGQDVKLQIPGSESLLHVAIRSRRQILDKIADYTPMIHMPDKPWVKVYIDQIKDDPKHYLDILKMLWEVREPRESYTNVDR